MSVLVTTTKKPRRAKRQATKREGRDEDSRQLELPLGDLNTIDTTTEHQRPVTSIA